MPPHALGDGAAPDRGRAARGACQGHGHAHGHGPARPAPPGRDAPERGRERRRLTLSLAVTAAIFVVEVIGGFAAHSLALLSDAGHMLSDIVAQALSLVALVIAARPADHRRTYGWYRLEILAALVNGLILFALSASLLYGAVRRFGAPVPVHTGIMLVVAGVGLGANLIGAGLLHGLTSLNARGAYLHLLMDTLSSVAVLAGGAVMWAVGGWYFIDSLLSVTIAIFILYGAYRLVREAVEVLLEAVPPGIDLAGVTHAIDHVEGVAEIHDLHIWTITSGLLALSAHLVVRTGHSSAERDALLTEVKEMLLRDFSIAHTTLQIESEGYEHIGHVC